MTLTIVSPTGGSRIGRTQAVVLDLTDYPGAPYAAVYATFDTRGDVELVWDSAGGLATNYVVHQYPLASGTRLHVSRVGGWVEAPTFISGAAPTLPWTSIPNCRLFGIDTDAVDTGSPNYTVTSVADKVGGAPWSLLSGTAPSRLSGPGGAFGWPSPQAARFGRTADATLWTAARSGDHSIVIRCRVPTSGTGVSTALYIKDTGSANRFVRMTVPYASGQPISYARVDPSSSRSFVSGGITLSSGFHTFGVTFSRGPVSGNSSATFFVDGAVGPVVTGLLLDLSAATGTAQEFIGVPISTVDGYVRSYGAWSGALTAANHLAIHNYLAAVTP